MAGNANILSLLYGKASYLEANQRVIADNMARVNIPGQFANELKQVDFEKHMKKSMTKGSQGPGPVKTQSGHLEGTAVNKVDTKVKGQKTVYEIAPTKNNISLEEELLKASENNLQMSLVHAQIKKYNELMKLAMGRGGF